MQNTDCCRVLGPLVVPKAGVQNEGEQTQVIQAFPKLFPVAWGTGGCQRGTAIAGQCPTRASGQATSKTVARDRLGALEEFIVPST